VLADAYTSVEFPADRADFSRMNTNDQRPKQKQLEPSQNKLRENREICGKKFSRSAGNNFRETISTRAYLHRMHVAILFNSSGVNSSVSLESS